MKQENILAQLEKTKKYLKNKIHQNPKLAIVCGSGLSNISTILKNQKIIPYKTIPNFKQTTAQGHKGELVSGVVDSKSVLLFDGRIHYYEGNTTQDITYYIKLLKYLGVENIIITFAAGGVNKKYNIGDIVVLKDHINLMPNPLIGKNEDKLGPRFPDLSCVYNEKFIKEILNIAKRQKIKVQNGVYIATTGPSYETKAEVKAFARLGADVVGMSVVPEAIVAKYLNMNILAIGYVANKATGLSKSVLEHKDVLKIGNKASLNILKIISEFIRII